MNAHNRLDLLRADGYRYGAPSSEAFSIDAEVAFNTPCHQCGGRCYYVPYSKPGSYRAFAICLDCGHEEEF